MMIYQKAYEKQFKTSPLILIKYKNTHSKKENFNRFKYLFIKAMLGLMQQKLLKQKEEEKQLFKRKMRCYDSQFDFALLYIFLIFIKI